MKKNNILYVPAKVAFFYKKRGIPYEIFSG